MREFKHKITGIKGKLSEDNHLHFDRTGGDESCHETIWFGFIENSQDWEEVVKPYWEVISFKQPNNNRIDTKRENGLFGVSTGNKPQKEGYYNENSYRSYWNIYSVKRQSDGVIFTVGDTVICNERYVEKISSIGFFQENHLVFNFENTSDNFTTESEWNRMQPKIDRALFTTEDGVEIFDEKKQVAWVINGNYSYDLGVCATNRELVKNNPQTYKLFSTREIAEQWILQNEKKYSLNNLRSILLHFAKDCAEDEMLYSHYDGDYRDLNKWIEENL